MRIRIGKPSIKKVQQSIPSLDKGNIEMEDKRFPEEREMVHLVTRVIQQSASTLASKMSHSELEDICKHLDAMRNLSDQIEEEREMMVTKLGHILSSL